MATYRYRATDATGKETAGQIEAPSADEARAALQRRGLVVMEVRATGDEAPSAGARLSREEADQLAEHLAQASAGHLPLGPGLHAAAAESELPRVAAALRWMAAEIERGRTLDAILADSDTPLPEHLRGLIRAALQSRDLPAVLAELVEHQRTARALRRGIAARLAYPLLVVCLAAVLLLAMVTFLSGSYWDMYEELRFELPLVTQMFYWWSGAGWVLVAVAVVFAGIAAIRLRRRGGSWFALTAAFPLVGPLWYWSALAEWCGLVRLLIEHRIPLPEALRLAADGVADDRLARFSRRLADGAAEGQSVWEMFSAMAEAPRSLVPLVRWGEQHGTLAEAFGTSRQILEARVRVRSALLQSILPPLLFIVIGCGIVFVVGALFAPLIEILSGPVTGLS